MRALFSSIDLTRLPSMLFSVSIGLCAFATPPTYVDSSSGLTPPVMEGGSTEIEIGDVNGDGHPDIVSIGDHGSPFVNSQQHGVMVWFGDGAGNWSVFQNGNFGYGGIALGDVNNDGLMDVGYGMHHAWSDDDFGDQLLEVALGDGTGRNWSPWDNGLATNGETWGMFGTDFADVDNDGDLDIGAISFGCCAGIHVYLNNGDGTWTQSFGFVGGNSAMLFEFGDFNGDGNADFAAAHGNGTVYFGDGTGDFTLSDLNLPGPSWRFGIALGDVNADGRDDLAYRTASGVLVFSWLDGQWDDLSGSLGSAGAFDRVAIVDMDLDGFGDIVASRRGLTVIYAGDGAGGWTEITRVTAPAACAYAALRAGVDADHNGFPDFALVQEEGCRPFVGGTNRAHFYKEASVPSEPWVFPKSPRGGEMWRPGSVHMIDWHAAVPGGAGAGEATMTLEVSLDGSDGPWEVIAEDVPNNGRFQWAVPADIESSDAHIRYTLHTTPEVMSVTPFPFTIGSRAEVATLTGLNVIDGVILAGGLPELEESDDEYLHTEARVTGEVHQPHLLRMRIGARTNVQNPSALDITIEGRITDVEAQTTLLLRDWVNGGYVQVDRFAMGLNETVHETSVPDASRFVRASDGRIRLEIKQIVFFSFTLNGFHTFLDQMEIVVR